MKSVDFVANLFGSSSESHHEDKNGWPGGMAGLPDWRRPSYFDEERRWKAYFGCLGNYFVSPERTCCSCNIDLLDR